MIESFILSIFKKLFENIKFNKKFNRFFIKTIALILSICIVSLLSVVVLIYMVNTYKSISYDSSEYEVARRMKNMIEQCFDADNPKINESTPNFMSWSRIQSENGVYRIAFKEVLGDIDGNGIVTDILRVRLNPSIYNIARTMDEATVMLFQLLPEFTPIGFLMSDVESIKKNGKMNIIIPINISNDIEKKLNIRTYKYNEDFKSFQYNPIFFTRAIIPNLGLKKNTGYRDTKLEIIWMVVTKNHSNIIYGFSWSFASEDKCMFPNGSIAKTQALIEIAKYAEENASDNIITNLFNYI